MVCAWLCLRLHLRVSVLVSVSVSMYDRIGLSHSLQVNWSALSRAQDVLRFVAEQTRIILLLFYGPDTRALLITALDENLLDGKCNI